MAKESETVLLLPGLFLHKVPAEDQVGEPCEDDPELGQSRLLEVDNRVVVPAKTHLRMIVTPADVPHSWAVPSSGVKCDAVPGRSNLTSISVQREGVYYGQCSEIRGTNHAFTPIVVEAVTLKDYADWVSNQLILQTN